MTPEIEVLKDQIKIVTQGLKPIQDNFCKTIADTTLPLDERWELFCSVPEGWKNKKQFYMFDPEDIYEAPETFYDTFGIDRHETVCIIEYFDNIESEEYTNNPYNKETLISWKEEAMKKNIGSFIYDW